MKEKRYEILKRKEREAMEKSAAGVNSIGSPAPFEQEILKERGHFEMPLPRSSPVNENGVQMQQGRVRLQKNEKQKKQKEKMDQTAPCGDHQAGVCGAGTLLPLEIR
ncbi:MAG: hypothetical protein IJY89_02195, partial [Clostridia bacterium]|nr:hypothetical protein [Clostridia bacterium]